MKKMKIGKILKIGGITIAALLVVTLVGIRIALPHIVKGVIQTSGTEALGQEVSVERVRLSILRSNVSIQSLRIAAAPGYPSNTFVLIENMGARISLRSLLSDTILVRSLELRGLRVNMDVNEDGGRSLADFLAGMPTREVVEKEEEPEVEEPAPPTTPPARPKGIHLRTLEVADIRIGVRDAYAWEEAIEAVITLGDFTINDLHIPPDGVTEGEIMKLAINDFTIRSSERFTQPIIFQLGTFKLDMDVPQLIASMEKPRIHLPEIEYANSFVHLENTARAENKPKPENLQEFLVALTNATGDDPKKLEDIEREAREAAKAREEELRARQEPTSIMDMIAAGIQRREQAREAAEALEEAAREAEIEEPAEPPFEFIRLDSLKLANLGISLVDALDESKSISARLVEIHGQQLVYPPDPSIRSNLTIRSQPFSEDTNVSVKLAGHIAEPAEGRSLDFQTNVKRLPLERVKDIDTGHLDADIVAAINDGVLEGTLKFRLDGVRGSGRNTAVNMLTTGPIGMVISDEAGLEVPFQHVITDSSPAAITRAVLGQIGAQIIQVASNRAQQMAREAAEREVGRVVDDVTSRVDEAVGRQLRELDKELDDLPGSEGAREAIEDVGGRIQGLFGRDRNRD
ncbi:MAG: AsmA family protein [Candidatus Sumerlaeia bacterium]|nr:AsmA family protein [Candidatus Sumerlaeia bacterium]